MGPIEKKDELNSVRRIVKEGLPKVPKRFESPRDFGCYVAYRRVDVLRIVEVARALSPDPRVIDVGCGNGDLLKRVREYIPGAIGVDVEEKWTVKPYIRCMDVNDVKEEFDMAILSWMELGEDYREAVSRIADVIISVWERGGACGNTEIRESWTQDFEEFGFIPVATWRTPAWADINMRLITGRPPLFTIDLGCIWEVWAQEGLHKRVLEALREYAGREKGLRIEPYPFERYYDEAGYPLWGNPQGHKEPFFWEIFFP